MGFLEADGDIGKLAFEPVETGIADIGCRRHVQLVDPAGEIVETFGERVVDRALVERIDLAGNIGEIAGQVRLGGGLLRALQHQRQLFETLFEPHGGLFVGQFLDAGSQCLDARTETIVGRPLQAVDLAARGRQAGLRRGSRRRCRERPRGRWRRWRG